VSTGGGTPNGSSVGPGTGTGAGASAPGVSPASQAAGSRFFDPFTGNVGGAGVLGDPNVSALAKGFPGAAGGLPSHGVLGAEGLGGAGAWGGPPNGQTAGPGTGAGAGNTTPYHQGASQPGETAGTFANVKYNNPGAMYPGAAANMFGTTGTAIIGGGHKIANFPSPVHGAAANMENLRCGYVGMTIGAAMRKWSGGSRGVPGPGGKNYDPNIVITKEMLNDPGFAVPFMKAIASGEAPGKYPMDEAQWQQAHRWFQNQGQPKDEAPLSRGAQGTAGGTPSAPPPSGILGTGASMPTMEGDITPPGASGGKWNVPRGTPLTGERETVRLSNGQTVTVNKKVAAQYKGFFEDMIKAGAPIRNLGGFGTREGNASQHPIGYAVDWAQHGYGVVDPDVADWIRKNQTQLNAIEEKWGMSGAEHWRKPDTGHFSIDTQFGAKHLQALQGDMDQTRKALDGDAHKLRTTKVEGTGTLTANISAPRGTDVTLDGGGIFKKTVTNRQIPMEAAKPGAGVASVAGSGTAL
jgi:hypothetical protein